MNTVFIQKDDDFSASFIWATDMTLLQNLLTSFSEDIESYKENGEDITAFSYRTDHFQEIHPLGAVLFDEVVVLENDEVNADDFVASCKEILNAQES